MRLEVKLLKNSENDEIGSKTTILAIGMVELY